MKNLTQNQKKVCSLLQKADKPLTAIALRKSFGSEIKLSSLHTTLSSLIRRKLIQKVGLSYRLLKAGHVAMVSDMTLPKLESALGRMTIDDIDSMQEATIVNLTTMLKNADKLPKKAIEQLVIALEKHGGIQNTRAVVDIDSSREQLIKSILDIGDCLLLPKHATFYLSADDASGNVFGTGVYSQPYKKKGSDERQPSIKQASITLIRESLNKAIYDYIKKHPETEEHKSRAQLRIRLELPVFSVVNTVNKKVGDRWQPVSTLVLEFCDKFEIYDQEKHEN